jgi:hypothetical protein
MKLPSIVVAVGLSLLAAEARAARPIQANQATAADRYGTSSAISWTRPTA